MKFSISDYIQPWFALIFGAVLLILLFIPVPVPNQELVKLFAAALFGFIAGVSVKKSEEQKGETTNGKF